VHLAVATLLEEVDRATLTVPQIAARAGVTPSTIYRRWGTLADLLADVAMRRMRLDGEPENTGSLKGDLLAWATQYLEEMSSDIGLAMMHDVLSASQPRALPAPCQCAAYTATQLQTIVERAHARNQPAPDVDALMDGIVAPIIYRTLFGATRTPISHVRKLVLRCVETAATGRARSKGA
jgi:AcrR family transcriptional regulator